jgi:hypothetical protein
LNVAAEGESKMPATRKWLAAASILAMIIVTVAGCRGFRRPMGLPTPTPGPDQSSAVGKGWSLIPTAVTKTASGDLHVDLAARNDTGDWSVMAATGEPAELMAKDGKKTPCDTVQVGTGGHYVPPGFQIRGYALRDNKTQTLFVECKGVEPAPGQQLNIPYTFVPGEYDYYAQDKGRTEAYVIADLDLVSPSLTYPVADPSAVKAQAITESISTLNKTTLENTKIARAADAIAMDWKVTNPGEYDTKVHIGNPPVLGSDGIIHGVRVSPDIVDQPLSPPKGEVEFKTEVSVPADVAGLYLLLSVEQTRERLFANYLIDLTALKP